MSRYQTVNPAQKKVADQLESTRKALHELSLKIHNDADYAVLLKTSIHVVNAIKAFTEYGKES